MGRPYVIIHSTVSQNVPVGTVGGVSVVVATVGRAARGLGRVIRSDYTMLAIPGFLATMAAEAVKIHRSPEGVVTLDDPTTAPNVDRRLGYEVKDTATSLCMGLGMLAIGTSASRALEPLDHWAFGKRRGSLGAGRLGFVGAVLAWDFLYYWSHRWGHERRFMWAAHVNHHSSQRYNLSTALRQSWTGSMNHWVYMPMLVAGFTPAQMARAGEVNLLYQYWVHTEAVDRLPPAAEKVLNTASHHRVHHGTNPQYLDRNYAGIFIIWDRLFGSFEPEGERVQYGLTKNIETHNPVKVAFHEWADMVRDVRGASSWKERVGYVLGSPGWSPESGDAVLSGEAASPSSASLR